MIYPKIKPELDRRRKFSETDIEIIKGLFERGFSIGRIAVSYGVANSSIQYIVDPIFKEKRKLLARQKNALKRKDPIKEKHRYELNQKSRKYLRENSPEHWKYESITSTEWRKKNPEKYKSYFKKTLCKN